MNTKSIKTVIIILLAAANIFFIFNIIILDMRVRNIPADMIENAVAVLRERGIYADVQKIPSRRPVYYVYEGIYSEESYSEIVRSFSGASDEEIRNRLHTSRSGDGIAFNVGEYKFTFEDYMQIEIVKSDYWDGNTPEYKEILAGYTDFSSGDANRVHRIIRDFLRRHAEQDARTGFRITGLKQDGARDKALIHQTINQAGDELLIYPHTAFLVISGGEVKYFSGRWYFGIFVDRHPLPLLDSVNILFRSLEQDGSVLEGTRLEIMERQYNIKSLEGNRFYLYPSWALSFDDGQYIRRFSYDMIRGNKNN